MSKNNDLLSTIKSLANNLSVGNKSAAEVAESLNAWLKDGGEAIKVKIEDEVERSVSKMGFVKRGEFEALKEEIAAIRKVSNDSAPKAVKKTATKRPTVKKAATKKSVVKKTTSTKKAK